MRNEVLPDREIYAKDAIKFYYKLARINGLTSELLEAAGLKNADSLRWSYNNGRISAEQINAYNHVMGVDKRYLIGEIELSEEIKSREMQRLKKLKKARGDDNRSQGSAATVNMSDMIGFYKDKIINCKNVASRNQIKEELEALKKETNDNIELLKSLIETMNILDDESSI
jgi:hypothetical protein